MGRYSQLIWLMLEDKMPTSQEIYHHYTSLDVTDDVKIIRRAFRREMKKSGIPAVKGWKAAEYYLLNRTLEGFWDGPQLSLVKA